MPRSFSLEIAERQLLDMQGTGLVITGASAPSPLRPGDVVRQANGKRTTSCRDLETATAEAVAKGLLLLLAVERDQTVLAVALSDRPGTVVAAPVPAAEVPAAGVAPAARTPDERAAAPAAQSAAPVPAPEAPPPAATPVPVATVVAVREAPLPARGDASTELAAKAVAAAAVLATVDDAARLAVPLGAYERRVDEAKNAIAALNLTGDGSAAVRAVIAEAVGYHETARDIRRYKAAQLEHTRVDQRGAGGLSLPYFSDSDVPRWIERYPFLSESLQQAPRSTHMLLPGEMAGRWNPDQAVELLWERAGATRERVAAWGSGTP